MDQKIRNIGVPLDIIKEELYGIRNSPRFKRKPTKRQSPHIHNPDSPCNSDESSPKRNRRSSFKPQYTTKSTHKPQPIVDLKALEEAGETIEQAVQEADDAVTLSPVKRKAYAKRYIAHMITSTFMVCDYDITEPNENDLNKDQFKKYQLEYLPKARDIGRPNARGGAITLEPQAPSERLDVDL